MRPVKYTDWLLPAVTAGLMAGILMGRAAGACWPAGAALLLSVGAVCAGRGYRRMVALTLAAAALGAGLGFQAYHPALPEEGQYTVRGTVVQEAALREDGQVQTLLKDVSLNGAPLHAGAYWTYYLSGEETLPETLVPGVTVTCTARVYHPGGRMNPGGFDFREYLLQRGATIGVYGVEGMEITAGRSLAGVIARTRYELSAGLMRVMGEEHGPYAAAMLLGSRERLAEDDRAAFSKLGIAHILSISGYHVGVLAGLLLLMLRPLGLPRGWRVAAEAAVLGAYCLLTGGNAPVVRAALLLLWREFTHLRHRQRMPLHMLCTTACIQLVFDPVLLTGASFQLTYCAMLGMLLLRPRLSRLHVARTRWGRRVWEAFCAALAAQIGVLLPQLYWFGQLPLLAILFNMGLMALASGIMASYWLTLAALPVPGLREVCGAAASGLTALLLCSVRALARLETVSLWTRQADLMTALGWLLMMFGLSGLAPRKLHPARRWLALAGLLLVLCVLIPLPGEGTTYIQFSVGNEDAAVLQDAGMTVVIDTGEDGQNVAGYLHQRRQAVDALILTHLHSDHAGGVRALMDEGIPVRVCYLPFGAELVQTDPGLTPLLAEMAAAGTELRFLQRGDVIVLPNGTLTALWPAQGFTAPGQDANHACLVLRAEIRGVTMLLTSDLSGVFEQYVQEPADILKAAHHGSKESTSAAFLTAVGPQAVLLSNADEERLARMRSLCAETTLLDTETGGAITVRFLGEGAFETETYLHPK